MYISIMMLVYRICTTIVIVPFPFASCVSSIGDSLVIRDENRPLQLVFDRGFKQRRLRGVKDPCPEEKKAAGKIH